MPAEYDGFARLRLDVVRGRDPIQGRLSSPNGDTVEFTGWLELAQVIDRAMDEMEEDGHGGT